MTLYALGLLKNTLSGVRQATLKGLIMTSTTHDTSVAQTIVQQYGGQRFLAMTGAKHLLSINQGFGLQFKLPSNFAKDRINTVRVNLTSDDLYDVEYGNARGTNYTVVSRSDGLFFDQLASDFTRVTGLYTTL